MRVRFSLRPPLLMNINKLNNLLELFYKQYQLSNKNEVFLRSLKQKKTFSWEETFQSVIKLSSKISSIIQQGDRCLLISENRPEWMISDLSIMLSKGITVPSYTCLLYTSPSPRDGLLSRMPSSA